MSGRAASESEGVSVGERQARAGLLRLAEPNDPQLWDFVERVGAVEALKEVQSGRKSLGGTEVLPGLEHYRSRLPGLDPARELDQAAEAGIRLVVPGDFEWPTQLGGLRLLGGGAAGDRSAAPPLGLWVRGPRSLRLTAVRSVAVVGSRAATSYGTHVAAEFASGVCGSQFAVFSGGAYGIDAAAHRGALAVGGATVAVLACGVDLPYPRGNSNLFDRIAAEGLLVSELPPGCPPTRSRFLDRNRLIAALTRGTLVVEAAARSGALNTLRWADRLGRTVLATPGPVTSPLSFGVHREIQRGVAELAATADDVVAALTPLGEDFSRAEAELAQEQAHRLATQRPTDQLGPVALRVVDALPKCAARSVAEVCVAAGLSASTVTRELSVLARLGLVEVSPDGWRLSSQ